MTKTNESEPTIVERIENYLNRYMVFPEPEQATAIALWVLHTWTFSDSFPFKPFSTPYLYVNSETPRSGKTLLIDLLEPIVLNPERGADMTGSVMFRLIETVHPTLFVDEVDTLFQGGAKNEPMRNVLNSGYKHSGYTWRNVGGEPTKFRTFCAKLLAGINNGKLPETVETRSLFINLRRVATLTDNGELITPDGSLREIYYQFLAEEEADQLVREIEAFMATWTARFHRYVPKPIPGMNPRAWEIAFPLIQIAKEVGIEDEARAILSNLLKPQAEREKPEVTLLRNIKAAFESLNADKLHTEEIVVYLRESCGEEGWNGKLLNSRLRASFPSVGATTAILRGNKTLKGYYKHQFASAWEANL